MLYCTKCSILNDEGAAKCKKCKGHRDMREVNDDDYVFLHNADQYTASLLAKDFEEAGIAYELKPFDTGNVSYMYDSSVMPTDKTIFVKYMYLTKAKELSSKLKEKIEAEQIPYEDDGMSPRKRILIQIISVILFFALIAVVVFAADYVADGLKNFFSGLFSGAVNGTIDVVSYMGRL